MASLFFLNAMHDSWDTESILISTNYEAEPQTMCIHTSQNTRLNVTGNHHKHDEPTASYLNMDSNSPAAAFRYACLVFGA